MRKSKPSKWSQFCDAMFSSDVARARKVLATMTDKGEVESATRWLNGPTAAQRAESAARQRVINATTEEECRKHCQFDGMI